MDMLQVEYLLTPQELLWRLLDTLAVYVVPLILSVLAAVIVILWVYSRVYGKPFPKKVIAITAVFIVVVPLLVSALSVVEDIQATPVGVGVVIRGDNMTLYLGTWGKYSANLTQCSVEWVEPKEVLRVMGTSIHGLIYGKIEVNGIEGWGIYVAGAEWALAAKCPSGNYIAAVPGIKPQG